MVLAQGTLKPNRDIRKRIHPNLAQCNTLLVVCMCYNAIVNTIMYICVLKPCIMHDGNCQARPIVLAAMPPLQLMYMYDSYLSALSQADSLELLYYKGSSAVYVADLNISRF
jgi:hypothetical protein